MAVLEVYSRSGSIYNLWDFVRSGESLPVPVTGDHVLRDAGPTVPPAGRLRNRRESAGGDLVEPLNGFFQIVRGQRSSLSIALRSP